MSKRRGTATICILVPTEVDEIMGVYRGKFITIG
jgi:hypothetical protein